MIPSGTFIRVVSGFFFEGKAVKTRTYTPMTSISVPGQTGNIIPLEVVPATDGSGTYVLVVALQDGVIDVGTVNIALTYNLDPPVLENGSQTGFQADINGNLRTTLAQPLPYGSNVIGAVSLTGELPGGSNTIGAVNQGVGGASAWKVDPSGVTSPVAVESMPSLPAGTNSIGTVTQGAPGDAAWPVALSAGTETIGATLAAPTASSSFAITPGASSALEAGHVLKAGPGNLYSLYVMTTSVSGYLMTFNATTIPADGAVNPVECIQIPANSAAAISFDGAPPDYYSTGIVAVFSSTGPFTKTASATAFFKWRVE
jgi:hypothetical protein